VKRSLPLILALAILAACGQSEPAATAVEPATAAAAATSQAAAPAATAAATAAESSAAHDVAHGAGHDAGHAGATAAAAESAPAVTPATAPASTRTTTPAASNAAGQPAASSSQTAPGVMTDPVAAAGFVEGRHFTRIAATTAPNPTPGQVEVIEFFMYSCVHCRDLEPYVQAWLPGKPAHINFVRVPTTWNETVRLHAQAFYAAAALGKGEEMHQPFFNTMHNDRNLLETQAAMRQFFARFGVSDADFNSVFESFSVRSQVNRADELGQRYGVQATPTIVIAGKYSTGVSEAGGYARLFELIEALAAAELRR
jgi:thiol:disulfide interchange protein DsbA